MARVTVRDVAAAAGVSATTVSHALNGKGRVDPDTRARIAAIAERLGYRPNPQARALRTGRTNTIALVSSISSEDTGLEGQLYYQNRLALAGSHEALAAGLALVLVPPTEQETWVDTLSVDGMIVTFPASNDRLLERLRGRGIPVVTMGYDPSRPARRTGWVGPDVGVSFRLVADHLTERGAHHLALLIDDERRSFESELAATYRTWAEANGIEPVVQEFSTRDAARSAFDAGRSLMHRHPGVDAVFAPLDIAAASLIDAARAEGRSVPDQLKVIGSDGLWTRRSTPPITIVDLHTEEQATAAVRSLVRQLSSGRPQPVVIVEPTLLPRGST